MTFRAEYVHDEDSGWASLVLEDEGTAASFEVRRRLAPDEQEQRPGTDTYRLVVDGASVHGGLDAWTLTPEDVLVLRLDATAAAALGVPVEMHVDVGPDARPTVGLALGRLTRRTMWDDLADRRRALALPMVPLRRDSRRVDVDGIGSGWPHRPDAVGIGPGGEVVEVRQHRESPRRSAVWRTDVDGPPVVLEGALRASTVQPLPDGRVLLLGAGGQDLGVDAEVWDEDGRRLAARRVGGAREHVLSTPSGSTWIGFFDEAAGPLGARKLVRLGPDLAPRWVWRPATLAPDPPDVFDVYALNVVGEAAYCYAYTSFHLLRVEGDDVQDLGAVDITGARALVLDGPRGALVGGYHGRHDVVTPFEITPDGVRTYDPVGRLVDLDGGDVRDLRLVARGDHLYALHRDGRRRVVTLEQLLDGRRV